MILHASRAASGALPSNGHVYLLARKAPATASTSTASSVVALVPRCTTEAAAEVLAVAGAFGASLLISFIPPG